ncbi:MAG TPA: M28 family peptidase [Ignavibacteriales bacterium]|nr:M28 family peptidase [Ignavibacteriales bacterium]
MKQTIILLLIMSFGFISCNKHEETPKTQGPSYTLKAQVNPPQFNARNAFDETAKQVSFGPRNPGSKGHQEALYYIINEAKKYADTVQVQNFSYTGYNNQELSLTNVIAKFNPKAANRIFISAHWDTRPRAEHDTDPAKRNLPILGANDGASGVGVLLELARVLKENPVSYGVDLVFFDGEDYGQENDLGNYFLGSKYFAAQKPSDYNPAFGILLDMVGDKDAVFNKEGKSILFAPEVVNMVWNIAGNLNAKSFSEAEGNQIEDDHVPLNESGIKTIDIIDIDLVGASTDVPRRNYWHSHKDTMDNISQETLQQVGSVLTYLIYSLDFNKPAV